MYLVNPKLTISNLPLLLNMKTSGMKFTRTKKSYLGGKVTNDISSISSPQGHHSFILSSSAETLSDSLVGFRQTPCFNHLVLVLNQQLHPLDRGGGCLGYGGRNSSHEEIDNEAAETFLCRSVDEERWRQRWSRKCHGAMEGRRVCELSPVERRWRLESSSVAVAGDIVRAEQELPSDFLCDGRVAVSISHGGSDPLQSTNWRTLSRLRSGEE